jgi:membrane protein implicated in regulation of membrane protease activity
LWLAYTEHKKAKQPNGAKDMNTILATVAALMILALTFVVGYIFIAMMGLAALVVLVPSVAALFPLVADEVKTIAKGA